MTDTDKLKRLAEGAISAWNDVDVMLGGSPKSIPSVSIFIAAANPQAILALIAENKRLKLEKELGQWPLYSVRKQRDEAVALLREYMNEGDTASVYNDIRAFLTHIDTSK